MLGWRLRKVIAVGAWSLGQGLASVPGRAVDSRGQVSEAEPYLLHQQQQLPVSAFRADLHYFERFDFLLLPAFFNAIAATARRGKSRCARNRRR